MKKIEKSNEYSKLLELYFEGETSLSQEALLRSYFQKGDILPEHRPYAPLFEYVRVEKEHIEEVDNSRERNNPPFRIRSHRRSKILFASIAAAVTLLLISGGILLYEKSTPDPFKLSIGGTSVNDRQLAVNITKNKLDHLNGILEKMNKKTEKAVNSAALPKKLNLSERFSLK